MVLRSERTVVSRIFLSHSSADWREAVALKTWLAGQDPPLANEIFLDLDRRTGIATGVRWKDALKRANARCEAVICLVSERWDASANCRTEYLTAENLNKQIFCVRLEPTAGQDITAEWQRCDLFGNGAMTSIEVPEGPPVQLATDGLLRLRDGIRGAGIGAESFVWPPPADVDRAPYRGWEPFDEIDAGVFFGREAAIVRALDAIRGMRKSGVETLFVVLGPSGTGKSSFLRAGVLPRLRREDRRYLPLGIVRPQQAVLTGPTGLAVAIYDAYRRLGASGPALGEIKAACAGGDAERIRGWLAEAQHVAAARLLQIDPDQPPQVIVLPLDQVEELFTADAGAEATTFLGLVRQLAEDGELGLIVAATIRTDRYEELQTAPQLAGIASVVFENLKPMPATQFKDVITGPARRATEAGHRLRIESDLEDALLAEATADTSGSGDTLPLLSLTLARLHTDYGGTGELTLAQYDQLGGMRHVVQTEINEILAVDPTERAVQLQLLRQAFIPWLATITPDNDQPRRRLARWDDLPAPSRPLIDKFVDKRLMVKNKRVRADGTNETVVEVALESLLRQWNDLDGWLREQRADLKTADDIERATAAWIASDHNPDWLLTGTRLADAEILTHTTGFADRLAGTGDYLAASRLAEDRRLEIAEEQRGAELRHAQERQHTAEAHAADLRKRGRLLRAVLTVTAIIAVIAIVGALVAVLGFVQANRARHQADVRTREAVALKLTSQGQAMLAQLDAGGDERAIQQILAAPLISPGIDVGALLTAVAARQNTIKILPAPQPTLKAVSSDAHRIVTRSEDGKTLRVWDAGSRRQIGTGLTGHTDWVNTVAFSPDGHRVVSGGDDKTVRVWDADTGRELGAPFTGHTDAVTGVAFSPDGRRIVSGGHDGRVRMWDADTGQQLGAPLTAPSRGVERVAFSMDGRRVMSGGYTQIQVWDADTGQPVGAPLTSDSLMYAAALSPNGHRVVSGGSGDNTARVWDADTGRPIGTPLVGHTDWVTSVAFSPDGRRIVAGGRDGTLRVWDSDTGQEIGPALTGHTDAVMSVAFSHDGRRIISESRDGTARIWDADTGRQFGTSLNGHTSLVFGVAFSPDGRRVVSGGSDNTIRIWDADTGRQIGAPLTTPNQVESVAFSPDGRHLVSAGDDGTVRIWDADTGRQIGAPMAALKDEWLFSVAFSPDGRRIVSGDGEGKVRIWDAETGRQISAMTGDPLRVFSVAFSPDGRRIVSGGLRGTVRIWDAEAGRQIGATLTGHDGQVFGVAFSPDGHRIVSGGADGTVRIWNADTGRQIGAPLTGHSDWVNSVAFSPDGREIVSGSVDKTVRIWDADTGRQIDGPLTGHTGFVESVAVSPDGRLIASASRDMTVRLWPGPTAWPELLCDKLTANMSHKQWRDWVSPDINYITQCPRLPIAPD